MPPGNRLGLESPTFLLELLFLTYSCVGNLSIFTVIVCYLKSDFLMSFLWQQ